MRLLYRTPALRVTAIERQADALRLLAENRQRFGCDNIAIVAGVAPLAVADKADAIFMGGSGGHLTAADRTGRWRSCIPAAGW
ncbi:cobalt-precorrin-6y C15-methyltransferase [Klebsiella pneumoniae]|uniref:Cobalt-precorrin-6y C15-methyltransferase n=1 Tax=Klebsiella pneumoniae TaxID=573 RepID=A0A3S4HRU9_KLEPN|nr:cobalt-precorrin-6y C15-methyltransferase [Klebsiella pneumoniae]